MHGKLVRRTERTKTSNLTIWEISDLAVDRPYPLSFPCRYTCSLFKVPLSLITLIGWMTHFPLRETSAYHTRRSRRRAKAYSPFSLSPPIILRLVLFYFTFYLFYHQPFDDIYRLQPLGAYDHRLKEARKVRNQLQRVSYPTQPKPPPTLTPIDFRINPNVRTSSGSHSECLPRFSKS